MAKKKDKHQHKTNAVRIVEAAGIYEMHEAPEDFWMAYLWRKPWGRSLVLCSRPW